MSSEEVWEIFNNSYFISIAFGCVILLNMVLFADCTNKY